MIEQMVPSCPKCGCARASRVKREGLLQKVVLSRFGLYPWECVGCRGVFTSRNRGRVRRTLKPMGVDRVPATVQVQTRIQFQTKLTSVSVYPENLRF